VILNDIFIANFPEILPVKKIENPLRTDIFIDRVWCTAFWDTEFYTVYEA